MTKVFDFLIGTFDFFLPRFCFACGNQLSTGDEVICQNCFSKIKIAPPERLHYEFERKFEKEKIISGFYSIFIFEKDGVLQQAIHQLKYNQRFQSGKYWGKVLAASLYQKIIDWKIDIIAPVPLHKLKELDRGYNQSYFISKGLCRILQIKLEDNILKRKRFTQSQTTMSFEERKLNISGAFAVRRGNQIKNKNILLIDDVITTGSTISECGKVLLGGGAAGVFAASIAIAD